MTKTLPLSKIFILLLLFILIVPCLVHAQINNYKPIQELQWRSLTGQVCLIPFFIDTPNSEFVQEEVEFYLKELEKSKEWILKQASNYPNVELEFIDGQTDSHEEIIYLDNVYNYNKGNNKDVVNDIAISLNFRDMEDYVTYHTIDLKQIKVVVLCFVKQNGRSHAFDFNRSIFSDDISIDHAIIFCNTKYGIYTSYKVITHEILHLFGAWDLYKGEPQNEIKAKKLKEMYPNSIMRNTRYNNKDPNLDELNAWRIGWNLNPKQFFVEYKPEYKKNIAKMRKKDNSIKFNLKKKDIDKEDKNR